MSLHIGDVVPDFSADTSTDKIILHDWIAKDWAFNFSHPGEFTPVCTTEIGRTRNWPTPSPSATSNHLVRQRILSPSI